MRLKILPKGVWRALALAFAFALIAPAAACVSRPSPPMVADDPDGAARGAYGVLAAYAAALEAAAVIAADPHTPQALRAARLPGCHSAQMQSQ